MASSVLRSPQIGAIALTAAAVGGAAAATAYLLLKHRAASRNSFVPVGRLANIFIYPIKSVAGIKVPYADCTPAGPVYKELKDRMRTYSYTAVEVSVEASQWLRDYLQKEDIRLVRIILDQETLNQAINRSAVVACHDESAFHVLSKASLEELLPRLPPGTNIGRRNFRPALFIDGCEAYAEDHWERMRIAYTEMAFSHRTTRCLVTTVDQDAGIRTDKEPLVTLRKYRVDKSEDGLKKYTSQPLFGISTYYVTHGCITVGDTVYAVVSPKPLL